ncbi:Oxalate:formate antiporter [Echinococcus granulosus]|nr:Oxalate:formate antiporter [Echinococcus granulosus]
MKTLPYRGILCVIGGFLYHLALGYFYTAGNMNPYVAQFMKIESSQTSWFSSTILALQATIMPLGAYLTTKISYRWVLLAGLIFSSGGILLTRLSVYSGLGLYILTYCILFGIGMGLPYSVIFSIASSWFPHKRATVVGIISAGFGLGALVFIPIQTRIINPDNLHTVNGTFPREVIERVPKAFLVLGGIVLGLEVVATILLQQKPEAKSDDLSTESSVDAPTSSQISGDIMIEPKPDPPKGPKSHTVGEAMKCIDFYILWGIVFLDIISVVLLTSTYKIYGLQSKFDDQFLSAVATVSAAFNCLGRVFWGFMVDRFSSKCPMMCFLLLWAVTFITFPYVTAGSAGRPLYAIWVFVLFFSLSAHFVVVPGTCTRIFGPLHMATIYGLVYFATCPSALLTAAIISQFKLAGQWIPVYTLCGCTCLIAFILALFIRDKDAHCVGFTNNICAAICDPLRKGYLEETLEDLDETFESDGPSSIALQKSA